MSRSTVTYFTYCQRAVATGCRCVALLAFVTHFDRRIVGLTHLLRAERDVPAARWVIAASLRQNYELLRWPNVVPRRTALQPIVLCTPPKLADAAFSPPKSQPS